MFVYGFSASGMTVQLHYCCGKLKNVDWAPIKRSGCGNEHKMGSKPCCETKQLVANTIDHFNFQKEAKSLKVYEAAFICHYIDKKPKPANNPMVVAIIQLPPIDSSPLFLQHCVFRI